MQGSPLHLSLVQNHSLCLVPFPFNHFAGATSEDCLRGTEGLSCPVLFHISGLEPQSKPKLLLPPQLPEWQPLLAGLGLYLLDTPGPAPTHYLEQQTVPTLCV